MSTTISNLWSPAKIVIGLPEMLTAYAGDFFGSGVISPDRTATEAASGGGDVAKIRLLREPDHADAIQIEDTAPTVNGVSRSEWDAPILNCVNAIGQTALSGAVSETDPVFFAQTVINRLRQRNRLATLIGLLNAAFDDALSANSENSFVEVQTSVAGSHFIDTDRILAACARLGDNKAALSGGVMLVHTDIETALNKQDQIELVRSSEGRLILKAWKGLLVVTGADSLLVRAGTGDPASKVYQSFIFAPGSIAWGEKPQIAGGREIAGTPESVASIILDGDAGKNNRVLYDRTRFVLQPRGLKWTGDPAGQSATNAELATPGNWALGAASANLVPIVRVQTNG
ncbi:MAG: hypothetical protein JJT96_10045 [Opitutales bacterium]|nr:hypothetical protein [Opitutales bacterium]